MAIRPANGVVLCTLDKDFVVFSEPRQCVYQLDATFKLIEKSSGRILYQGKAISRAPYNRFQEIFANVRARYDAENRAARTISESIRTQVAGFLANAA